MAHHGDFFAFCTFTAAQFKYNDPVPLRIALREERRLRVFENRVLRIHGPKRDEVIEDWRKLHNEELHGL
jgi:hypothetical protein